jgi:lipopolysaccharide/colanic/teichoic acid biosynthesis glycosyltransferase
MIKRAFDASCAACGLLLLSPLFLVVAVLIKRESPGDVFFLQERVGRHFRRFRIVKFRTMVADAPAKGGPITAAGDPRITGIGRLLRRTKVDELPQLWNVLKGEMSLVGPRPEVPEYVEMFKNDYAVILQVPPGITDLATLTYRDEERVLSAAADPAAAYRDQILPRKLRLARESVARSSLLFDVAVVVKTLLALPGRRSRPEAHSRH